MIELERETGTVLADVGADYGRFVRPRVQQMLRAVRMDVAYHRAEGDYLYYRSEAGDEVKVLDLLGGFGATLFGHNHPYIAERAQAALAAKRPFHAQASVRSSASALARRLSDLVGRSTGQQYVATFASSGAEGIEAALKHAGAEYTNRSEAGLRQIRESVIRLRRRLPALPEAQVARLLDDAREAFGQPLSSIDELLGRVLAQLTELPLASPVVWSLRRGFHGKTTGALRLTHNPKFRAPWSYLGNAVFLDATDPTALPEATRAATLSFFVFDEALDGSVSLAARQLLTVLACFVEPIQGEGGIWELDPEFVGELRAVATRHGFPLVFDEIQSGLGRTGSFLASEALGVTGDYYVFSKSLGGGLAKISATLVERSRYVEDFGYLHTSTFAEDDWSCEVALAALELLEQKDGKLYKACRDKGRYLRERLEKIRAKYPRMVREVRGRGLMIGLELETERAWKSRLLRVLLEQDLLGFMLAGYLLREKQLRVAPGLSANTTLRLEPSAHIGYAEIDVACSALEHMIGVLDAEDTREFLRVLVRAPGPREVVPASRPNHRPIEAELAAASQ